MTCGPYTASASPRVRATHASRICTTSGLRPALRAASLIYVGQLCRAVQAGAGRAHEAVGEPTGPARGRRHAGAEPERRSRPLERPRCDLHILERVMLASE